MVKNELSLHAQQTYEVAKKIAEHNINKLKNEIAASISVYKAKISFKTMKQEEILFNTRKEILKENLDSLFTKNPKDAKVVVFKNNYKMHRLNWSFVKIDRNNPNKEAIKKQIALNRHSTVIYDMNYNQELIDAKWLTIEKENEIKEKLEYDRLKQRLYGNNAKLEEVSYEDFYQNVVAKHEQLTNECKDKLNNFYPVVEQAINKAYDVTFARQVREEILSITKQIIDNYKKIEQLRLNNISLGIDLQILSEQAKEKLDVAEEIKEVKERVNNNNTHVEELLKQIKELSITLEEKYQERIERRLGNFELGIKVDDNDQQNVLEEIKEAFKLPSNEVFSKVYRIIKEYVLSLCPFFYDYLDECERNYKEETRQYQERVLQTLTGEAAKVYIKESEYLKYLSGGNEENSSLDTLKVEHEQRLVQIKEELKVSLEKLKTDKKARKAEYISQKENAKINLKLADGTKAAEIRDVVKLYKKEINSGEFKRYIKAFKENIRKIKEENELYKDLILKATNPEAISYIHEQENAKKQLLAEKKKEYKDLNRALRKDYSSSKYRKNLNTSTRENGLGYLFLSIWAVGFLIFTLVPILYSVLMMGSSVVSDVNNTNPTLIDFSFTTGLVFPNWTGTENFETLFLQDVSFAYTSIPRFFRSLLFFVPIVVFIGFVLAMLLNSKIKGRTFFRIIYFLPVVIVSGPVLEMLNGANTSGSSSIRLTLDGSAVAKILMSLSPKALEYANEIFQNFVIILWMTGVPIVLFISALQKINKQLYEAAEIDGANKWQMLWTITFPLIKSVMLIVCLFTIMQVATINVDFVNPINMWLYTRIENPTKYNLGVAAVGAWCQTLVILIFVLVAFLLFREKEFVSKDKNYEEIEEAKRKKNQRRAKMVEFFHINEIKHFFDKLFAPVTKLINASKARKEKKELEG